MTRPYIYYLCAQLYRIENSCYRRRCLSRVLNVSLRILWTYLSAKRFFCVHCIYIFFLSESLSKLFLFLTRITIQIVCRLRFVRYRTMSNGTRQLPSWMTELVKILFYFWMPVGSSAYFTYYLLVRVLSFYTYSRSELLHSSISRLVAMYIFFI